MKKISLMTVVALTVLLVAATFPAVSADIIDSGNVYFENPEKVTKTYPRANPYYKDSSLLGFNILKSNPLPDYMYAYYIGIKTGNGYNSLNISKNIQASGNLYWMDGSIKRVAGTANVRIIGLETTNIDTYNSLITIEITSWDTDNISLMSDSREKLFFDDEGYFASRGAVQIAGSMTADTTDQITVSGLRCTPTYPSGRSGTGQTIYNNIVYVDYTIVSSLIPDHLEVDLQRIPTYNGKVTQECYLNVYNESEFLVQGPIQILSSAYVVFPINSVCEIESISGKKQIFYDNTGGTDDAATVTVYIKNSQTGALIADANVVIDALVNGEYYPVANRTEPSGIFSITLQPTGGGQPNPDGYRLIVTADGYNNPMPEINFTVDDYKIFIYCLLDPIAGGPENENKTFIDFFVRDMSSNPISGATVKFGKYTLITNSAGYTVFEVDKNNNYSWTVSKSGYGSLTGNAVIGADPRHTINTVLAPTVTPIKPTPIPTSPPIGPTPTMTAPTGEPVSNWLEWFAAHFGMILGGGVEIGKIFMWLCFTVPVGVYVGKEAKAGAAGFMAGAGIVTLFFVLIGWVPIWLVVLLALIIGLLYAKVFNAQDNGGGR